MAIFFCWSDSAQAWSCSASSLRICASTSIWTIATSFSWMILSFSRAWSAVISVIVRIPIASKRFSTSNVSIGVWSTRIIDTDSSLSPFSICRLTPTASWTLSANSSLFCNNSSISLSAATLLKAPSSFCSINSFMVSGVIFLSPRDWAARKISSSSGWTWR